MLELGGCAIRTSACPSVQRKPMIATNDDERFAARAVVVGPGGLWLVWTDPAAVQAYPPCRTGGGAPCDRRLRWAGLPIGMDSITRDALLFRAKTKYAGGMADAEDLDELLRAMASVHRRCILQHVWVCERGAGELADRLGL